MGVQVGLVIGGGNFWRGVKNGEGKMQRSHGDAMGMLATVMNAIAVADVLDQVTPELAADVAKNGIILTGGSGQIWGMDRLIAERMNMNCTLADDSDFCVAYGCGKSLQWMNHMTEGPINIDRRRKMRGY